jgi:hypothetical protein
MTGPNSKGSDELSNFITPKQQQLLQQKKERRKFIFALILSNALTSLVVGNTQKAPSQNDTNKKETVIPGHTGLSLALKLFVPLIDGPQPIALYNKKGQLIVIKAILDDSHLKKNDSGTGLHSLNRSREYFIWVPNEKVSDLTKYSQDELMAYPFNENIGHAPQLQNPISKKESYELIF